MDENEANRLKKKLLVEHEVTMAARKELVKVLKWHRKQNIYAERKAIRKQNIKDLRKSLDYPEFNNIEVWFLVNCLSQFINYI